MKPRWLSWIRPEDLVAHELAAAADEGRDLSKLGARWAAAGEQGRALALDLLDAADAVPLPVSAAEPETFEEIAASWPVPPPVLVTGAPDADRVHGAWLGRAVGCLLGKPVEKIPREGIREILAATGRWPLTGYFTAVGLPPEVAARWPWNTRSAPTSLVENIDGMPEDDDLNFPLIALRLLETRGRDFTSLDVAQAWMDNLPAGRVFTAERIAYRNLLDGLLPPESARRHNPYREWIGAQIRTDVYGWATAGRPAEAAELAYRDATVSHVRGGVYGAMWAAALTSAAVVASDVDTVLDAGESVLPPASRFAAAVREARALGAGAGDWEAVVDAIYARHGHLHWVHVRNNAALVAAALAFGQGDVDRSVCAVVSGGWDTDSNGATVGSVVGALAGAAGIPSRWKAPLKGRLASSVPGFDGARFADLAARTVAVAA